MIAAPQILSIASLAAAVALWLLLPSPRRGVRARAAGAVAGAASLGLFASLLPGLGDWSTVAVIHVLGGVTLAAAAGTISSHNPIYSALWFGLVLLGTAGLFMVNGAQFLAVATVSVYAGAILVTFLFVLMLAQPEGRAPYDRASTEPLVAAAAGAVIVGVLSLVLGGVLSAEPLAEIARQADAARVEVIVGENQMVHFGHELFGRHLGAVDMAGLLLLVALVSATAIAPHLRERPREGRGVRGERRENAEGRR